jgi:hypothetical protein
MSMFEIEGIYEFTSPDGEQNLIIQFLGEQPEYFECKIVGGNAVPRVDWGCNRNVYKASRILKNWKCKQMDGEPVEKTSGVVPKKRRTPAEIQMDNFLDGILMKHRITKLREEIDVALANGQKAVFMALTKELNKLQKKVIA